MRPIIFLSILFISFILIGGCVSQTTNPLPMAGPQPPASNDLSVHSGGSALAIAFKTDEISTTSPEAKELFLKGLTYSTQYARYNESLAFFDAALTIDRNFSEAWVAKGVALHNMKRYEEAINTYDRALLINYGDAGTWSVKCITLRDAGKTAEAAECNQRAGEYDAGYRNNPGAAIPPARTESCDGSLPPVQPGGDVWIGESCLNVSAVVSSGQVISWYKNGHPGNATSDAIRIVYDARNFFADPGEYLGYEGTWYVGTTDTVAFVVRVTDVRVPPWDENSTGPGPSGLDASAQTTALASIDGPGKIDNGLQGAIDATKNPDFVTAWVILDEPPGLPNVPPADLTPSGKSAFRDRQRGIYLNSTKPLVDYVRNRGFVVDYIGQTSPAIEVLASPPFMKELANRSDVRKMVLPKTNHQVINEMLLHKPDETIHVSISLAPPGGLSPWPVGPITEQRSQEYYAQNKILYENQSRYVVDRLLNENVRITYGRPVIPTAFYGEVPVHLLEIFNSRPEVVSIKKYIQYYLI